MNRQSSEQAGQRSSLCSYPVEDVLAVLVMNQLAPRSGGDRRFWERFEELHLNVEAPRSVLATVLRNHLERVEDIAMFGLFVMRQKWATWSPTEQT